MGHKILHRKQKYKQSATKYYTENKNINNRPQNTTQKTTNINNGPQNTTQKTKDEATSTSLKTKGDLEG
jgi:hypothetical protein